MEVIEISSDNSEEFLSLIGPDVADDMKRVFYRGIGVKNDDDEPVGALIFELKDSESDNDTRSHILFAQSPDDEVSSLMNRYYRDESVYNEDVAESYYEFIDPKEADILCSAGFSRDEKESDFINLTLDAVSKLPFAKTRKLPAYIDSISTLSVMQYRSAIKDCLFKGQKGILEDLAYLPMTWFDRDISSCSISDGNVDGLLLVRATPSGILIPVFLYAHGADYVKRIIFMLLHSVFASLDKYPPETQIWINRKKKATRELLAQLVPGVKGENVVYGNRKE